MLSTVAAKCDCEASGIDRETLAAKMHVDIGNAKPATEAVKGAPAAATRPKRARSTAPRAAFRNGALRRWQRVSVLVRVCCDPKAVHIIPASIRSAT